MAQTNIDVVALGFIPLFRGQGMVGIPLLASFRKFAVDFRRSELVVGGLGDELLHARRCMTIPIIYRQSHLFMPVRIDGKTYELTVDIGGFNGTMTLDGEAAKEFANSHPHQQAGEATGSGQNAVRIYVSENCPFQAGDYGGKAPVVLMPDTPNSGPGTVGNAFFGKTVVGVDLDAGKLYFLPTETATDLPINQSTDQPVHLLAGLSGASIIAWSQLRADQRRDPLGDEILGPDGQVRAVIAQLRHRRTPGDLEELIVLRRLVAGRPGGDGGAYGDRRPALKRFPIRRRDELDVAGRDHVLLVHRAEDERAHGKVNTVARRVEADDSLSRGPQRRAEVVLRHQRRRQQDDAVELRFGRKALGRPYRQRCAAAVAHQRDRLAGMGLLVLHHAFCDEPGLLVVSLDGTEVVEREILAVPGPVVDFDRALLAAGGQALGDRFAQPQTPVNAGQHDSQAVFGPLGREVRLTGPAAASDHCPRRQENHN